MKRPKPKVVVINGYPESGKTSFVNFCYKHSPSVVELYTSYPAKKALMALGWNGSKNAVTRKALADLKVMSNNLFDGSMRHVLNRLAKMNITEETVVFIHCREPKEIARFVKLLDAKTLLITRAICNKKYNNPSDNGVESYKKYDHIISNDGSLEELEAKALGFMSMLKED